MLVRRCSYLIGLIATFSLSLSVVGKRYSVPKDSDVLFEIGSPEKYSLNKKRIKILVWNMYKGDMKSWKKDYQRLSKKKDLILFQEFYMNQLMKDTFQNDRFAYQMASAWVDNSDAQTPSGVGIASRVKPLRSYWQRSHYLEPIIKTPKVAIFNEYDVANYHNDLLVISIHAINFVSTKKLKHMLENVARVIVKHKGPVIWGGDFNPWSKSKTKVLFEVIKKIGLKEVKFSKDTRMRTFNQPLDYVFVRGLKVNKSYVHGDVLGSDHKAMEVNLSLIER